MLPGTQNGATAPRSDGAVNVDETRVASVAERDLSSGTSQGNVTLSMFEKLAESPGVTTVSRNQHWKCQVLPGAIV